MSNLTTKNQPIQLQAALIPVCKMVIRFGLHFHEFVRNLQKAYIFAAKEILEQAKIGANLQAIAIKTGMDRRTIAEHLHNKEKSLTNPLNKMDMVIRQLQIHCVDNPKQSIHLYQLQKIIDAIYAQHIRSKAIIKELIANKIVVALENSQFKLNLTLQQQLIEIRQMADEVDFTAKRLFQTYYKNMFNANEQATKLWQKTCFSSKIPPSKHKQVAELLSAELKKSTTKMQQILTSFESNLPENTYPEIGVTQFQFNSTINDTKNT